MFGFEHEVLERMAQARFIASKAVGFEQAANVYAAMFNARLTRDEQHELVDMLEEVANHDGPSEQQAEAIAWFKPKIGVAPSPADLLSGHMPVM